MFVFDPSQNGMEFSMGKQSPLNDSNSRQTIELSRVTGMYQPSGFIDDSKIIEML